VKPARGVGFWFRPALLLVLVVATALAVTYSVHEARRLTARAQELRLEQDRLKTHWGQLLLERSTWGAYGRVERLAREELNMKMPEGGERVLVKP
jgi:cell division protein FtsL